MANDSRRPPQRRKRSQVNGQQSQLGGLLADLRTAKGFTLRQVEEATGNAVSNAYLSQLEKGRVQRPSPNVLHSLAAVYGVPHESLMEKAGYLMPSGEQEGKRRRRLGAFALADLSSEEEEELLRYLAFLRSRKPAR